MRKKEMLKRRYAKWGYIFVIPFIIAFLVFHFWPLGKTIILAFTDLRGVGNTDWRFLPSIDKPWYANFTSILQTKMFKKAFVNTFVFWIAETVPEWIFAFWLAAIMTDRRFNIKGKFLFRTVYFLPRLISAMTMGTAFLAVMGLTLPKFLETLFTIIALDGFGIETDDLSFLWNSPFWIVLVNTYMHFGFTFIYAYAGITSVPTEVFEAAEIDGATRPQTFFRVTLPCMRPIVLYIAVMSILDGLGMWEISSAIGGDHDAQNANTTIMMFIRNQAFDGGFYGRASAMSVLLLIIYGVVSAFAFYLLRDKDEAELKKLRRKQRHEEKRKLEAKV